MAKEVTIEIKGLERLIKKYGAISEHLKQEIDAELAAVSNNFVNRAVEAAPVDNGFLKSQISFKRLAQMQYEVVSAAKYSPYVEFGTITHVKVPAGLESYAMQFKGKGIKKTGGVYPHPFFFPQLPIARKEMKENVTKAIERVIGK